MTENQFKFDRDTVATNLKTPIVYDEKEYLGMPATGTLKNSVPNDPIDAALKLYEYKNAHDYKDEEFPKLLQKRREYFND